MHHKSLPSVCVFVCVSSLSLVGNGFVKSSPRQRIHETKNCWTCCLLSGPCIKGVRVGLCLLLSLRGNGSVNTYPRQLLIVGGVVLCEVHVVSEENRIFSQNFLLICDDWKLNCVGVGHSRNESSRISLVAE
jgi:hypothetical protein